MVGPGTGLAPFRGFLQDRSADFKKGKVDWYFLSYRAKTPKKNTNFSCLVWAADGKTPGETVLFYGCRRRNEDYLYQQELETYADFTIISLEGLNPIWNLPLYPPVFFHHFLSLQIPDGGRINPTGIGFFTRARAKDLCYTFAREE